MSSASKSPKARKKKPRGLAVYTESGAVPAGITAARTILVLAFAMTIPFVLGVEPGRRLFWAAAIASLPLFWVTFGYHLWRRLCPLAVVSQLGRILGIAGKRRVSAKGWLAQNYMVAQLGLMVIALSLRLTMTNGTQEALALFLGIAAVVAAAIGFFYTGKTWCNYLCPVGMVEKIYIEPARLSGPTNSQCSPCTACKKNCPDIDLEQAYWKEQGGNARRLAYFSWPGIVAGFYLYYYLVAGDWHYYFSGAWTLEDTQLGSCLGPGFFFLKGIPIAAAAPLTLIGCGAISAAVLYAGERVWLATSDEDDATREQTIRHRTLTLAGFAAFIIFYYFGGQPTIRMLPSWFGTGFATVTVIAATTIFTRRWRRSEVEFVEEKFAEKILRKWEWGDKPESDRLHDIYLLHHERKKERDNRIAAYKDTVREMVADGVVTAGELAVLTNLRGQLGVSEKEHKKVIDQLGDEDKQLFDPEYRGSVETRLQMEQYRDELAGVLVTAAHGGVAADPRLLDSIRDKYEIAIDTHDSVLAELRGDRGPLIELARGELAEVSTLGEAIASGLALGGGAASRSIALLGHILRERAAERIRRALGATLPADRADDTETMAKRLTDRDQSVRERVCEELATLLDVELSQTFASTIDDLWPEADAAPSSAPLIRLADDPSPHVRAIVAHVLSRFDDDEARGSCVNAIEDEASLVREAAVYALGVRGRLNRELMSAALDDPSDLVRRAALVSMGPKQSSDPRVALARADAAKTVSAFATLDAKSELELLTTLERMALLSAVPLFSRLDPTDLEEISRLTEERRFTPGEILCREGDEDTQVFVIIDGSVEVTTGDGKVLGRAGAGDCIGEMAAIASSPRSATVVAGDMVRTLTLPGTEFTALLQSRPTASMSIIEVLVGRLRGAIHQKANE